MTTNDAARPEDDSLEEMLEAARDIVTREADGVRGLADQFDESFLEAVRVIYGCTGKVFVTGAGTSGAIARRMAHLFSVCGTPSMFIQAADALHGTMGAMSRGDVLIAISRGGGSAEINELTRRAQDRGTSVIALTAAPDSELARAADVVAPVDSPPGVDPGEVIAMGSTLVAAVWGDAVAVILMRLRGYGWDSVLHSHPSGAVGQLRSLPDPLPPLNSPWPDGAAS